MSSRNVNSVMSDLRPQSISRREFIRRTFALGLSASGLLVVSSACRPTPTVPPTQEPPSAVDPTATPTPALPQSLNILLFSHDAAIQQAKGPAFQDKYGVTPVFETVVADDHRDKIISAHRAATSPWDTLPQWATVVQEMAERGWLVDLTEFAEATLLKNADDLVSGAELFQAATFKDRIYAIPDKVGGPILQWNTSILEKRGLDRDRPKIWHETKYSIDEFIEWAKECTFEEGGVQYWGFADQWGRQVAGTFQILIQMFGGDAFDLSVNQPFGEPTMNSEEGVTALQWMVDLLHKHKCIDPASLTYDWVFDFTPGYLGGRTAFIITWPFVTHVAQDPEQSAIVDANGYAPNFAAETSATSEGTEYQAISSFSPHGVDAAWKWLEHMSSYEMMRLQGLESGWAPIYKSLLHDPEITQAMFEGPVISKSLDYPRQGYFTPDSTQWDEILRSEIHDALRQTKKPKEALDRAVELIKAMRAAD